MNDFSANYFEDPEDYLELFYRDYYSKIHGSETMSFGNRYMHKSLENNRGDSNYPMTLELGCGNFEHVSYVKHEFQRYIATDIRSPREDIISRFYNEFISKRVEFCQMDAHAVFDEFGCNSMDRILSGCLLMHLNNPYSALISWQKMLRVGGVLDLLVPCDPGLAIRFIRRAITERNASNFGINKEMHRFINAVDHVSSFERLRNISIKGLQPHFRFSIDYRPFPLLKTWNFNVFSRFTFERMA